MTFNKLIKYIFYGIQWGCFFFVVMNLIALITLGDRAVLSADAFIRSALSAMLAGIGSAGTSVVYTFDHWSSRKQTAVHFVVGITTYFIAAYFGGWIRFGFDWVFFSAVLLSILIFWIIWLLFYLFDKKDEKHINEQLKRRESDN